MGARGERRICGRRDQSCVARVRIRGSRCVLQGGNPEKRSRTDGGVAPHGGPSRGFTFSTVRVVLRNPFPPTNLSRSLFPDNGASLLPPFIRGSINIPKGAKFADWCRGRETARRRDFSSSFPVSSFSARRPRSPLSNFLIYTRGYARLDRGLARSPKSVAIACRIAERGEVHAEQSVATKVNARAKSGNLRH